MNAGTLPPTHRHSPRVALLNTHATCARSDGHKVSATVLDLSTGGALLEGPLPLRLGELFVLRLGDLEMRASAVGMVGSHIGVRFDELSPVVRAVLERRVHDAIEKLGDVQIPDGRGGYRLLPARQLQMQSVYDTLGVSPSSSSAELRASGEAAIATARRTAPPLALAELERLRRVWTEPGVRLDHDVRFGLVQPGAAGTDVRATTQIGRYRVLEHRASGGVADVFVAVESIGASRERFVALKRVLPALATNRAVLDMFVEEAYWLSRIQHPNVVQAYELGEHEGAPYLALEYVPGWSLRHLIVAAVRKKVLLPVDAVVAAVVQACAGLHAAHELTDRAGTSLIHRDISPQNLLVTMSGHVKLVDFGNARLSGDTLPTDPADPVRGRGRAAYLAPEQIRREAIDRRADVYALGVVAWELLVERRLTRRASEYEVMAATLSGNRPPIRQLRPDVPEAIADVIHQAVAVDVGARWQTAEQFKRELQAAAMACGLHIDASALGAAMTDLLGDKDRERKAELSAHAHSVAGELKETRSAVEAVAGVRGNLADMSLAEIVQSVDQSSRSVEIQLSVEGVAVGLIGIQARTVVAAACGALRGAEAFIALHALREGHFFIRQQEPRSALHNVHMPAELLLLEAMRSLDEGLVSTPGGHAPLPPEWRLDAGFEDPAELVARLHDAARAWRLEAELASDHAKSTQEQLVRTREVAKTRFPRRHGGGVGAALTGLLAVPDAVSDADELS